MTYTEQDAKNQVCPQKLTNTYLTQSKGSIRCVASRCMAWHWLKDLEQIIDAGPGRNGYCGLAGKPE